MAYICLMMFLIVMIPTKNTSVGVGLVMLAILGFYTTSYGFGYDWVGYFDNYMCLLEKQCAGGVVQFEWGYNAVVSWLGLMGFQAIIVGFSIFNLASIYFFAQHFRNKNIVFAVLFALYGWFLYTEAIRQSVALSIILLGYHHLFKPSYWLFSLYVALAALFHSTAFICFSFFIPLLPKRIQNIVILTFFVMASVLLMNFEGWVEWIFTKFSLDSAIVWKIFYYSTEEAYEPKLSLGVGFLTDVLLIYAIYVVLKSSWSTAPSKALSMIKFGAAVYIFIILMAKYMPVMARLAYYFSPFIVCMLALPFGGTAYMPLGNTEKVRVKVIVVIFIVTQAMRPLIYEHSRVAIFDRKNILQNFEFLDNDGFRKQADEKCDILISLNMGFQCIN